MTVKAVRTYDPDLVRSVMMRPEIWATAAEDGQLAEDHIANVDDTCWLAMWAEGQLIGLYNLHAHNSVTVEIHAHVLPDYRKRFSHDTGVAALQWLMENAAQYKKVVAQVPVIYENVKKFTCSFGFKVEGVNRLSYEKNGELVDQWLLGITQSELEEFFRCRA